MTPTREERERGERLRTYCDAVEGKPVEWGVSDCSTWPLQWVLNETGREADWPVYSSREEADAIIADAGGLVRVWERMAPMLGLVECYDPLLPVGSVAVVDTRHYGPTGCIMAFGNVGCFRFDRVKPVDGTRESIPTDGGWAMWALQPRTILKAWSLP